MASRLAVLLAFLVMVAPSAAGAAGWSHSGGDARHRGLANVAVPPDVIGRVDLTPEGFEFIGGDLAATPEGVVALVHTTTENRVCTLARLVPDATITVPFGDQFDCGAAVAAPTVGSAGGGLGASPQPALIGYDPQASELVACVPTGSSLAVLRGFDSSTGRQVWAADVPDVPAGESAPWSCRGAAIDMEGRQAIVPFFSAPNSAVSSADTVIAVFDLETREWKWFDHPVITQPPRLPVSPGPITANVTPVPFFPESVSLTDTGIVVLGAIARAGTVQPTVLTYDLAGRLVNTMVFDRLDPQETASPTVPRHFSTQAATRRHQAATVYLDRLYLFDAASIDYQIFLPPDQAIEAAGVTYNAPTTWVGRFVAAPVGDRIWVFDVDGPGYIGEVQVGGLYVTDGAWSPEAGYLALSQTFDFSTSSLRRFDLAGLQTLQEVPLGQPADSLLDLGDGRMLAWDSIDYGGVMLGPAQRPGLDLSVVDDYPAVGAPVAIPTTMPGASRLQVSWGTGEVEPVLPGTAAEYRYSVAGDTPLSVTVVFDDNTTATTQRTLHVGQSPPPDLNAIQVAFSDKNQNFTFGILGLLLTLLGFLVAVIARSRRRSRVAGELDALDAIRQKGRSNPAGAFADVAAFRLRLKGDLSSGRLDDSQFAALELEVRDLMAVLRERVLGTSLRNLSQGFAHAFEVAVLDGHLEATERTGLLEQLGRERLSSAERNRLGSIIESWPA